MLYYGQNMVKIWPFLKAITVFLQPSEAAKRVWAGLLRSVLRSAAKQLRVDRGWARLALLAISKQQQMGLLIKHQQMCINMKWSRWLMLKGAQPWEKYGNWNQMENDSGVQGAKMHGTAQKWGWNIMD